MLLDDSRIKSLVEAWQKTKDERLWDEIAAALCGLVRNYPRFRYGRDEDACSEFLAFLYPRLKSLLANWRPTEAKFTSWFFVVLRCRYLDFVASEKTHRELPAGPLVRRGWRDRRKELDASERTVVSRWRERQGRSPHSGTALRHAMRRLCKELDPDQRLLLHLLFDEVSPEELGGRGGDGRILYEEYCRLRLRASDRIRKDEDLLTRLGNDIVRIRRRLDGSSGHPEERRRLTDELERKRAAFERIRRRLLRHDPSPPYAWISRVTGRSVHSLKHDFQAVKSLVRRMLGPLVGEAS